MKKVLKIASLTLVLSLIVTACGQRQFDRYKETFLELNRDPESRNLQGSEGDVNDLSGCPYLSKLGEWRREDDRRWGVSWSRRNVWRRGTMSDYKIFGFDLKNDLSNKIITASDKYPVYLGPWQPITLTHAEGSFLNKKEITEQKQIRFFAYYPKEGGRIEYQYESQTFDNKNIPEKKFSLSPTAKYAPDKFGLCVVKWTAKYGYNAVADLHKNPWFPFFSRQYLVGSGKIIDSETGETIADEKGNLVKSNTGE